MRKNSSKKLGVLFLSFVGPNYSRSSTLLNYHSDKIDKKYMEVPRGIFRSIKGIHKNRFEIRSSDCLVVMSPCHFLTPALKLVTRKPIILDAGWPLTDGHISRGIKNLRIFRLPLIVAIDLISFCFADIVLVESEAQAKRVIKFFAVQKSKIRVQFTGLNESSFTAEPVTSKVLLDLRRRIIELGFPLIVLFRGKINRESGFDTILEAAEMLKDSVIFIFLVGKHDISHEFPRNVIAVSDVTDNEMQEIYKLSDISLGQISTHRRLRYTIPHKAFEAGFFSMPYITARSAGVQEYLPHGSALFLDKPSTESLVDAIEVMKNSDERKIYAKKMGLNYDKNASQEVLSKNLDKILLGLCDLKANKSS